MKLPKKVTYLLFIFLIFLSMALRAGYTPQHGGDTWANHIKADTVSRNGAATWVLNPLSYFGWYPYSYPTGEHLLLSAVSQISGLKMDATIVLSSSFFGMFGLFSVYLLVRLIRPDDLLAVVSVLIFATFDFVVNSTWNAVSTRALFIMFYPIIIFFLLRAYTNREKRITVIVLALLSMIAGATIHRIVMYFLGTVVLPYLLLLIFLSVSRKIKIRMSSTKISFVLIVILILLYLIALFEYISLTSVDSKGLQRIVPGDDPFSHTFNIGASYGTRYGITAIFAPMGVIYLINRSIKRVNESFLIATSFVSIMLIFDTQYFMSFYPPITAIVAGFGVTALLNTFEKRKSIFSTTILVMVLLLSTQYFQWYIEKTRYIPLIIGVLGAIFVMWCIIKRADIQHGGKKKALLLIGLMLISTSFVVAAISMVSLEYAEDYPVEGKWTGESRAYTRALWVKTYAQGGFVVDGAGIRNTIQGISGLESATTYLEVADNEALKMILKPEFNASLMWENRQNAFEYEVPSRYDPKRTEYKVLCGDHHIAEMYEVNFIILPHGKTENYEYKKMVPFLEENRYILFEDMTISIYHYACFSQ